MRHDLQEMIFAYLDAAGLRDAPKDTPLLFRPAVRKEKRLYREGHPRQRCVPHDEGGSKMRGAISTREVPTGITPPEDRQHRGDRNAPVPSILSTHFSSREVRMDGSHVSQYE